MNLGSWVTTWRKAAHRLGTTTLNAMWVKEKFPLSLSHWTLWGLLVIAARITLIKLSHGSVKSCSLRHLQQSIAPWAFHITAFQPFQGISRTQQPTDETNHKGWWPLWSPPLPGPEQSSVFWRPGLTALSQAHSNELNLPSALLADTIKYPDPKWI